MQKQSFSKIKRHLAAILVWALLGNLFLPMTTQATAVEEAETNRLFEGLSFFVESDETTGTTAYTTGDNSVTVTTYAQAEADPAQPDWYRYHARTSDLRIQNDSGKALRVTYRVEAAAGNDEGSTFTPVGTCIAEPADEYADSSTENMCWEYTTDVIADGDSFTVTMTSGSNSEYAETRGENHYPAAYMVTVLSVEEKISNGEDSDKITAEPQQTDTVGSDRIGSEMSFDNISLYADSSHPVGSFTVNGFNFSATADYDTATGNTTHSASDASVTLTSYAHENVAGTLVKRYTYTSRSATLKIQNKSGKVLDITYTIAAASGNVGQVSPAVGTHTATGVVDGGVVEITITSGSKSSTAYSSVSNPYPGAYTVTVTSAVEVVKTVSVTFETVDQIDGVTPGSYTVKREDGTALTLGQTYDKEPVDTKYVLTATENPQYHFSGWYKNGETTPFKTENPLTTGFSDDSNTVKPGFYKDPLYSVAVLTGAGETESKGDYVEIDSEYYHKDTGHSYHWMTGDPTKANDYYNEYFPDPPWSISGSSIVASASGKSTGDAYTGFGEQSQCHVYIYSDVIRVRALKDCSISFTDTISGSKLTTTNYYYYVTKSSLTGNVANTVKSSGVETASGTSTQVSLSQGQYLYIMSYSYATTTDYFGTASLSYSFTSTISNFTIQPLNTRYEINATFQDNTGIALGSGKLKIGDTTYTIGADGKPTTTFDAVAGASVTLSVATVPSNYVLVGWRDVTAGTTSYTKTYSLTLNTTHEIQVLFAPVMTITMGSGGYSNATYQYKNLSGSTVTANGQYVARNTDATKFYTTLSEAFADTASVVLLAGDTFNGDFTVPSGKTLVIPFGMDDAASTTPIELETSSSISGYYATVTFNGNVTVDGGLLVSAKQAGANQGRPGGYIGRLNLSDSATLTVNGILYAFGYVSGGAINVSSSGKVYEFVEIRDMRNFTATYNIYDKASSNHTFLFNDFFIRNIESSATYQSGASLTGCIGVKIGGTDYITTAEIKVIGKATDVMFNLTSGSMTKSYDRANDQTMLIINEGGTAQTGVASFGLTVSLAGITQDVNVVTSDYFVPLCHGFGVVVNGNFTFNNMFKFLPGSTLTVGKTGTLTIASGAEVAIYRMNDYDTRSTGTGDTAQGFSPSGYPVNTTMYFPSVSYPFKRTAATTGSAKVHVDGTVNVLGSLCVTDQLSAATNYDNGYNILTGTGKIILDSAKQSSTTLYEATQTNASNDIIWATVALSSIKGLPYEATADAPENYSAFTKTTYYGYINERSLSTWSTDAPKTLTYDANGGTGTMDAISVYPGKTLTVAANGFTYGNYVFVGWNTAKDGTGTDYDEDKTITMNEDVTLYAMWRKVFTITWKNYNGKVLQTDVDVAEGDPVSYRGETPTKPEDADYIYTFSGWAPEITVAQADTVYTAQYSQLAKNVKLIHADSSVNYYETVNDAVNASAAGETVVLLKNCTENVVIPAGKSLSLDLNGKNITATNGIAIENNGTLNIQGNGTVSATSFGSAISNSGSIGTISGGTFVGVEDGLKIASGASVGTISGGTFKGKYAIQAAGTVDAITNGTFTGTTSGLYINGGTVTSISGGTFTGLEGLLFSATGGTVGTISGGSFTGSEMGVYVSPSGVLTKVSGGTFVSTSTAGGDNSYAVKNTSSTPIQFTATGAPETSNYVGPLFKAVAVTRTGTLSDPDTNYTYPTGMTLSGKANTDGYFYIAPNVFTLHFEPNSVSAQGTIADQTANRTSGSITLPTSGFTRNNYVFVGWSLDQNAGYADASVLKPDSEGKITVDLSALNNPALNETVTLYAVWKQNFAYSVTVTWGNLSFTYQPTTYKWDGEKMQYVEQTGGWSADGDNTVKVANNTEIPNNENLESGNVQVRIDYQKVDRQYNVNINDVEMRSSGMILSNKLSPGSDITAIVLLTGTPPNDSSASNVTVGKLTLALTPADG